MAEYEIEGVTLEVPDGMLTERLRAKFESGDYEGHEAHAARMRVKEGMRVLELGSGVGFIAAICAGQAGAENVHTVEANPDMLPVIRANLDRNGFQAAQVIHGAVAGLGAEETTIAFERKAAFWAGRIAGPDTDPEAVVEVPLLSIETLLAQIRPHVVIMDIEGAEAHLFGFKWPRHVRSVMMELHPRQYPESTIKKIVDCMSRSGLTYDPVASQGRILGFRRVRS